MVVMGIDPSTHCGVAVVDESGVLFAVEIEFKNQTGLDRAHSIISKLKDIKEVWKPDLIVIEDMFVGHASSAITIIQIGTIIRYHFWLDDFPVHEVSPTTLKKFMGGGKLKKEQIMMAVLKKWGYESRTNNIADAVVLAKMGLAGVTSQVKVK